VLASTAVTMMIRPKSSKSSIDVKGRSFGRASDQTFRSRLARGDDGREGDLVHLTLKDVFAYFPPQAAPPEDSIGDILGLLFISSDQPQGCTPIGEKIVWTTSPVISPVTLKEVKAEYDLAPEIEEVLRGVDADGVSEACLWSFGRCERNAGSNCAPEKKYLAVILDGRPYPSGTKARRLSGRTLVSNAGHEQGNAYHFVFDYMYSIYQIGGGVGRINSVIMNQLGVREKGMSRFFKALRDTVGGMDVNGDEGWWIIERAYVSFGTTRPLCVKGGGCNSKEENMIKILRTGFQGMSRCSSEIGTGDAQGSLDVIANTVVLPRANRRTLLDPEVIGVFEQFGEVMVFEDALTGDYTPAEFFEAGCGSDFNIVVGVHGANMANVLNVARPEKTCVIEIVKETLHQNPRIGGLYAPIMGAIPVAMYESFLVPDSCDDDGYIDTGGKCYQDQVDFAQHWKPRGRASFWDGRWRREYEAEHRDDNVFVVRQAFEKFAQRFVEECKRRIDG